jgi:uncharacterized protein (TIGR00661 family)
VRILYGVSGEGSGHSSRARVVLRHLLSGGESRGHEVKVVTYNRGVASLAGEFDVFEVEGLHIRTAENRVDVVKTFTDNVSRLGQGLRRVRELARLVDELEPECVLTDFEPTTAYLARAKELPLVSIDNQHRMRYMDYPRPAHLERDALVTQAVIRAMVPSPDAALVTTFYFGEVKNERTFLFPPILRQEVRALEPARGDHVLVYFTQAFGSFLDRLRALPRERFVVYGMEREGEERNLRFERPSQEGFLEHLASCKAVIATAGFTLMTEAMHLGKPMLALPMRGQFEQELNALLLEDMGCGKNGRELHSDAIGDFLYRLPDYEERLAELPRTDDSALCAKLDELLADGAASVRALREVRRSG